MIQHRKSAERGHLNHGWLDTYHSFSFGSYYDPDHMGFRALRVINEDWVATAQGFGTHPHNDMEIITYMISGTLTHRDSMGNAQELRAGEVQAMTAGTGITHSEANQSSDEAVKLLQIWLMPRAEGLVPQYKQTEFTTVSKRDQLRLIVSSDARDGSLGIHQDTDLYATVLTAGTELQHNLANGRHAWVQVISGAVTVNGSVANAGDGIALSNESSVKLKATTDTELLLFDLS
jgi:redox-sensitive bicupin YhaK (pirin superfamily)